MLGRCVRLMACGLSVAIMAACSSNDNKPLVEDPNKVDNEVYTVVYQPPVEEVPVIVEPVDLTVGMEKEITALAKTTYGESRGIASVTEQACVMWTILNRYDAGGYDSIMDVITKPNQFHYIKSNPTVDDYGRDLEELAKDVLTRWLREKNGEIDVGRVLPSEYTFFHGKNKHNWFRRYYEHDGVYWNYSLESPYES